MSDFGRLAGVKPYGKPDGEGFHASLWKSRSLRPMLHCYFCGGRVVSLGTGRQPIAYRCEAEGVRWEASENLTRTTPPVSPDTSV